MIGTKQDYFDTPLGQEIKAALIEMHASDEYATLGGYSPNSEIYATNAMSFVEKHMEYIRKHPNLNAMQYISNLKIMSRKRK